MALLKTIGGWFRAKDREASQKIEDSNVVGFATNDLDDMKNDLATVHQNIGKIKGRISTITDDIKDLDEQIANNTSKAEQLLGKGTKEAEDLAAQLCTQVEGLEKKLELQKSALAQQENLLKQQQDTEAQLEKSLQECQNELELMKTQKEVADANKTLVKIDASSAGSAVQRFKERNKKLKEELAVSTAMVNETKEHATSLSEKADAMLGNTSGSALLAKLKAKKEQAAS